ncbi:MAG: M1 family aminopeptidase [Nitrospiraceae bacterium]
MKYLRRVIVCSLLGLSAVFIPLAGDSPAASDDPTILHHRLTVELRPPTHELIATDRLTVKAGLAGRPLAFSLAPSLRVERIEVVGPCAAPCRTGDRLDFQSVVAPDQPGIRQVVVASPHSLGKEGGVELAISYRGVINDPPRDPRHLRFVTPSETSGHIGEDGVYLSSETQWYPDLDGSLATFETTISVPEGWVAVSQGATQDQGRHWTVDTRSEALTVVANRFVVKTRDWQSPSGQAIELATYLFPEDAALADEYLDASARYLAAYIPILGPYPFSRFAVVENFFSSGLGMPSFTLLGSGVIKRHYTQPYALGHEIVHSWIGNGVFNRVDQGNWVEGLTTYLANYYYHEFTGDLAQAREQRRLMLLGYGVYVGAARDYPVGAFTRKSDEKDNAIGYQKSAMVFHALRQEIGDAHFWKGIRTLVAEHLGRPADWKDIERVFQVVAGRDLRWFFAQWVERAGAPTLTVESVEVQSRIAHPRRSEQPKSAFGSRRGQQPSVFRSNSNLSSPEERSTVRVFKLLSRRRPRH